ncbi:hypothetical protein ILYODFUR_010823 [Ilyodon furcidens]|uniref:Uncharacterized protein n=1 Tax=Ilyodon furcidens TaxID=33524 RepID=A0ABV0SXK0_9TELE
MRKSVRSGKSCESGAHVKTRGERKSGETRWNDWRAGRTGCIEELDMRALSSLSLFLTHTPSSSPSFCLSQ